MKSILKRILFICSIFILSTTALSYAGTLIKKVYFSGFPIYVDGEEYSSQNPILSYQDRTYMPLREFAEMLGVKVDFEDGKIYLKTPDIYENNERKDDGIEEEKGSPRLEAIIEATKSRIVPVAMASGTTILGMLPLLFDAMFGGMAACIMGGLLVASLLTIFVLPVTYSLLFRVKVTDTPEVRMNEE